MKKFLEKIIKSNELYYFFIGLVSWCWFAFFLNLTGAI